MLQQHEEPTKTATSSTEIQSLCCTSFSKHETQDFDKITAGNCICKLIHWDTCWP
jgi:hypothetical protein